jgi:hypothetical protein
VAADSGPGAGRACCNERILLQDHPDRSRIRNLNWPARSSRSRPRLGPDTNVALPLERRQRPAAPSASPRGAAGTDRPVRSRPCAQRPTSRRQPDRRLGARLLRASAPCAIPATAEQAGGRAVCLCISSAERGRPLLPLSASSRIDTTSAVRLTRFSGDIRSAACRLSRHHSFSRTKQPSGSLPVLRHEVVERLAERIRIFRHAAFCEAVTELIQHLSTATTAS